MSYKKSGVKWSDVASSSQMIVFFFFFSRANENETIALKDILDTYAKASG
jgi:hypothetical protein